MSRAAVLIATAFGVGHVPIAPGTAASGLAVGLYFLMRPWPLPLQAGIIGLITFIGVWSAGHAARHFAREDPTVVVIDEVAGQLIALFATHVSWRGAIFAFLLFRFFDVFKPPPVDRLERLPGGAGIMADDVMAGVYSNLVMQAARRLLLPGGW